MNTGQFYVNIYKEEKIMIKENKKKLYEGVKNAVCQAEKDERQCFRAARYALKRFDVRRINNRYYLLYEGECIADARAIRKDLLDYIIDGFYSAVILQCKALDLAEALQNS